MASGLLHCQLWMGGLEPYMTESFVMAAFQRMGEQPQNVKVMRNKYTGEPAGYCFVHFATDEAALNAMHKLSGKIIPNTQPAQKISNCKRKGLRKKDEVYLYSLHFENMQFAKEMNVYYVPYLSVYGGINYIK